MNICLLIKTNSAYSYLWPIIEDYIKDIKICKVLAYNEVQENKNLPKHFDSYIKYDQNLNFSRRLLQIIPEINSDYILFVPDVDIILNLNVSVLNTYVEIMKEHNIDRVNTAVFDGSEQIHKNNYGLCNLNKTLKQKSNHFVPIDCSPTIWKKTTWLDILNKFIDTNYNSWDLDKKLINYCKNNINCYGIQYTKNLTLKYNRGLTMSVDLSFLHITAKGRFLKPFASYHDYEKELMFIIKKYKLDVDKIGFWQAPGSCLHFRKLRLL